MKPTGYLMKKYAYSEDSDRFLRNLNIVKQDGGDKTLFKVHANPKLMTLKLNFKLAILRLQFGRFSRAKFRAMYGYPGCTKVDLSVDLCTTSLSGYLQMINEPALVGNTNHCVLPDGKTPFAPHQHDIKALC